MGKRESILVKKLYEEQVEREWGRLVRDPFHKLEFDTTLMFLNKHLPKKGHILDAGGGPGRYTIHLAKKGYDMTLLDLIEGNLVKAKEMISKNNVEGNVKAIHKGDIVDLSMFKQGTFDAVICLGGPLSHVHPESKRIKAINELVRVAKKGSPIFISVMGKFGTLIRAPGRYAHEIKMTEHFKKFSIHGDDYQWNKGRSFAHYFELEEIKSLLPKNVEFITQVGLEGISSAFQDDINNIVSKDKLMWKNWINAHIALCTKPTVADSSLHFMIILRKK